MTRWPIESLNGRIKNVFKYFDGILHNWNIPNVGNVFRVCCAVLNALHPPIQRNEDDLEHLAAMVHSRLHLSNVFQNFVTDYQLLSRRMIWTKIENDQLADFPQLTIDDLREITLGTYQIKQAASYTAEHLDDDGKYYLSYFNNSRFNSTQRTQGSFIVSIYIIFNFL